MATTPSSPFSYVLIGAGRVGSGVAELLRRAGNEPVGVASRTADSANRAAELLGAPVVGLDRIPECDVVLVGVTDRAIPEVVEQLGPHVPARVAIHFAGALGIEPFDPLIRAGWWGCALHPVQACPDVAIAIERLPGSAWGVTCTWPATEWAHGLVRGPLAGIPVDVPEDARPLWHAAAVSTSNTIAAALAVGESLLASIGVGSPESVLGPLARGTVDNAISGGGGTKTLTGPAVRGDTEVFALHVASLRAGAPDLLSAYAASARLIIEAGTNTGQVDPHAARAILELLEGL